MATKAPTTETGATAVPSILALEQLSFASRRPDGDGVMLWSPPEGGEDWAAQCRLGRALAREALDHIRLTDNIPLLPGIVRAIVDRGTFGGVEVGFFTALSIRLAEAG